jgi:hypothetical protein
MMYVPSSPKAYEHARAKLHRAESLYRGIIGPSRIPTDETKAACLEQLSPYLPTGWWEHWKSGNEQGVTEGDDHWKFYAVRGPTWRATGVIEAEYAALYTPESNNSPGHVFYRPLFDPEEGFFVPIALRANWKPHPYEGPRFVLIRELSLSQCDLLIGEAASISMCATRAAAVEIIEAMLRAG